MNRQKTPNKIGYWKDTQLKKTSEVKGKYIHEFI